MTGKAMVPIVERGDGSWDVTVQEQAHRLTTEPEVRAMEKRISDRGYYPVRVTPDELAAFAADAALVDARFRHEMLASVERWMAMADDKLRDGRVRCIVSPANDDIFEVDPIIQAAARVEYGEGNLIDLGGFTLVSLGWANPTPWKTWRELPEPELRARIDGLMAGVTDRGRAVFNLHAPPYGSNLDAAPELDANMKYVAGGQALRPVGSRAVREAIADYGPALSLHGHIHEGKGAVRLGRTLAVNPGSSYEDGVLQAAVVDLDAKKGDVKSYMLVSG
jgi:Icc-related predicted phosphoesterase